jgi:hypothetical protein
VTAGRGSPRERRADPEPRGPEGAPTGGTRAWPVGDTTADDTAADDCAMDFLSGLDDVLWILEDTMRGDPELDFRHATNKALHVRELRRILYRTHVVLVAWERELGREAR